MSNNSKALVLKKIRKEANALCFMERPYSAECFELVFEDMRMDSNSACKVTRKLDNNKEIYYTFRQIESDMVYHFGLIDHEDNDKWWSSNEYTIRNMFGINLISICIGSTVYYMTPETIIKYLPKGYCLVFAREGTFSYINWDTWRIVKEETTREHGFAMVYHSKN